MMQTAILRLYSTLRNILSNENGQDLIEYALVVALIAFAAIGGMQTLATDINQAFMGIGNTLVSNI
jgi:pilus assembly protein Flp/PilA